MVKLSLHTFIPSTLQRARHIIQHGKCTLSFFKIQKNLIVPCESTAKKVTQMITVHNIGDSNKRKNSRFPLYILGYVKNTHKNPKFGKVRQVPTKFPCWDLSHSSKFGIFVGIL